MLKYRVYLRGNSTIEGKQIDIEAFRATVDENGHLILSDANGPVAIYAPEMWRRVERIKD